MAHALTWMATVLRQAGLSVQEVAGWQDRGHGNVSDIRGVMMHHTAGPAIGNFPSLDVVVNGRPGLAGPLSNLGLARDGTWYVIAAGRSYHAGAGYVAWCGRDNGNNHIIGIEAESTGRGDWTQAQLDVYPRGVAVLLRHLRLAVDRAIAHKEWAPSRKIDPAGWPGDMTGFRAEVAQWITGDQFQQSDRDRLIRLETAIDELRRWPMGGPRLIRHEATGSQWLYVPGSVLVALQAEEDVDFHGNHRLAGQSEPIALDTDSIRRLAGLVPHVIGELPA
ncbi:N-acetylmuramoyl-L-alanine amidase [Crossiella sp. SN42]|uniref:N-acetylmuramoyl-L-alanine amidase n=1 Tax=Crossiella sp. SN42 TaxID=2944808 RepID=UPI00207D5457|nr:N-acetylmuramoyl-L-alanine amidase [Crossiella sp. SN42]MCO1578957.1 N-acetylmuramoyl-L-alanine amidase [Crossiella sp. SN42]